MVRKSILTSVLGIPTDCSGRFTGVERMPGALRKAGLVEKLEVRDSGNLALKIDDPLRDKQTGIIGFKQVCKVSNTICFELTNLINQGEIPLLLGGCCTLLIGVAAALNESVEDFGLVFVDGHLDFYDGKSSPTGEAADMDLAILTGIGPRGLIDITGKVPLVRPDNIVVAGFRDAEQSMADGAADPAVVFPGMKLYNAETLKKKGTGETSLEIKKQFENKSLKYWLHLDLDVLDEKVMPAVDYRMPGGLSWEDLRTLIQPIVRSPLLLGLDVTIFNPTLDTPDQLYAKQIVEFLSEILTVNQE
ncbi:MAG: arginase family protein [Bacteroidales bacterium]